MDDVNYSENDFKGTIQELRSKRSFLQIEEEKRDQELRSQIESNKEESKSVLERIAKKAGELGSTLYVEYEDVSKIKREKREKEKRDISEEISESDLGIVRSGGRPKKPEEMKVKKYSVSIEPKIDELIEKKRNFLGEETTKSGKVVDRYEFDRSRVVNDLLKKAIRFENLRKKQARELKEFLQEYGKEFDSLRIWQKNRSTYTGDNFILLEDNIEKLGKLFLLSKKHQKSLEFSGIEMGFVDGDYKITDSEILKYLSKKEISFLEFALNPAKLGRIVKEEKSLLTRDNQ